MPWFELKGDERITQRCATEGCPGQVMYRLEADGVGANYCSGCKAAIEANYASLQGEGRLVPPHGSGPDNQ